MNIYNIKIFCLSLMISGIVVPIIIWLSRRLKLYDPVNSRKLHNGKISRLGGFGIFIGFLVPFLLYIYSSKTVKFNVHIYMAAVFIIFLTGFIDDVKHIRARYKLILQIISGSLVAYSGLTITELTVFKIHYFNFGVLSYPITVLWVIAFINAINLLDGMDGLASGVTLIANIFVFILANSINNKLVSEISIIMAGTILGFYLYNFPPAKIFMGDSGAYFIGFMYATIPLMGIKKSSVAVLFVIPLLLLLIPFIDIVQVVVKRIKLGYNIFIADKNHLHHRLLNLGLSIRGILLVVYLFTTILGLTSILMTHIQPEYSLVLFLIVFLLMFLSLYLLNSAEKIINGIDKDK